MNAYRAPKLSAKKTTQLDQGLFDFLVPFRSPTLTTNQAARCLEKSVDFVLDLIDTRQLEAFSMNAKGAARSTYTVTRRSVLLFLVQSARLGHDDFLLCLDSLLDSFDCPTLDHVIRSATVRRAAKHRFH